ncbi:MAG: TnpV protein [Lachnospiraceae bacterium]|nr:TnpV protein [Lachnospiraceae bacterium]
MNIEYIKCGDYYIPNLRLPPQPEEPLTKYGRMRKNYLKEYRPATYNTLLLEGTLKSHCLDIQEQAQRRMDTLIPRMAKSAGVTEELKRTDQMKWVGLMNNIHAAAEEIVREEIIFY